MQTQTRAFRAPDSLWAAVVAAADATGVNTSEILRRAAAEYGPVKVAREKPESSQWQATGPSAC